MIGTIIIILGITGCTVEREVDFQAGKEITQASVLFGSEPYLPDIETFMQIGYADYGGLSPDGKTVFFKASFSGVSQLYRLTENGWPYQLTLFDDGIDWYTLSNSGQAAIVGASIGGSEQSQLILVDALTGRIRQLTNNPDIQYGSVVWSNDDNYIYYRSNIANKRDFKLYQMDIASGESQLLVDTEGWNGWGDISLDGSKLTYYNLTSNVNDNIYVYDTETGQSELVTPHEGDVFYDNVAFSRDGTILYLTSDGNEKGIPLRAKIDLATKKLSYLEPDSPWIVEGVAYSPDRKIVAWVINEDGYGRMKMAETETGKDLPVPKLDGLVEHVELCKTSRVLFTFNSPTQTFDIWSWDWKTQKLEQVSYSTYAGIDRSLFTEPKLITYKSFDGLEIPAFIYLPPDYEGGPIPFILHMHGGPESQFRPTFARHFQYLMLNGFGILAPNVRGSEGYGKEYMAMDNYKNRLLSVKDMKAGGDWLIANGYTRQGMIGVKGGSYGGYMAMAAITEYPDFFSAALDGVGIVNFVSFLENTSAYRRYLREAEYGPLTDKDFLQSISPLHKAHLIKTPLLVVHGENDPRVPVGEARQIINAINKRGGVVDTLIFPDEGHGIAKLENRLIFYRKMIDFFKKHLQG
jgi:dipeptidyl aminopeptidase/acylaminoacyl peptidase